MIDNKHELEEHEKKKRIISFKEDWGEFLRKGKGEEYANIEDAILFSNNIENADKGFFQLIYGYPYLYLFTTSRFFYNLHDMPSNSIYSLEEMQAYTSGANNTTTVIKLIFVID